MTNTDAELLEEFQKICASIESEVVVRKRDGGSTGKRESCLLYTSDTMTLEKVEKEPEIYVLPEVNERAEGVANWFQTCLLYTSRCV